ncbi:MAG TPA: hypothetical protein VFG36_07210 [Methanoregula sp.]|nr:hypothetical protein [Methanoregula sp.]
MHIFPARLGSSFSIETTGETPVAETTPEPTLSPVCEFTSCHGLDLQGWPNPHQACTAVYQLGDKCRKYAFCSKVNTTCQLVTIPQFDTCRSCTGKCGGADTAGILLCGERC